MTMSLIEMHKVIQPFSADQRLVSMHAAPPSTTVASFALSVPFCAEKARDTA
jgi:hypothetical protein